MKVPPNIKPRRPNLRYCSREELDEVLLQALEGAAYGTPCDLDRAILPGMSIRDNKLDFDDKVIEGLVMQFLSKSVTPSGVETVSWFLPAFWSAESRPDPKLLDLLTEYLASDLPYLELQEALILCLDRAFGLGIDSKMKKRIHGIFRGVSKMKKYELTQPIVATAMDRVLNSPEFT